MWKKQSANESDGIPNELKEEFFEFKIIGGGTYGTVYRAKPKVGGSLVAFKKIKLNATDRIMSMSLPASAMREILILRELNHPNIVALRNVYFKAAGLSLWLWFDHCPLDLRVLIKYTHKAYSLFHKSAPPPPVTQGLTPSLVSRYARQLFSGLEFVHKLNIIHRDLKPQNILMNDTVQPPSARHPMKMCDELKRALLTIPDVGESCVRVLENGVSTVAQIADFGLSRCCRTDSQQLTHEVVTLWYRAPEILLGCEAYSNSIDVWSLGCILAEMVCGRPLFAGDSEIDTLFKIFKLLGTPTHPNQLGFTKLKHLQQSFPQWSTSDAVARISEVLYKTKNPPEPNLVDLVCRCLQLNPNERISCTEALKHPYFKD